jgi:dTDP-4-dehydrorhamnose reductase
MTDLARYLVVGGDSLVGSSTVIAFAEKGIRCLSSTRRREAVGGNRVFMDFENEEPFRAPKGLEVALVIAAATNYDRCETDPSARVTNVELIPRAIENLLSQGIHVTFISTNSVFGGDREWPHEDDPHHPQIAYALQKSEGEAAVLRSAERLGALNRLNIVRLTKIMNSTVPPLPAWIATWKRGEVVTPFEDLVFAPISTRYVGSSLVTIAESRLSGNLHLSGAENVDYVRFATMLAQRLGFDDGLIAPTTSVEKGIHIAFKPRFSGLGMERTSKLTGLLPQTPEELIEDIVHDLEKNSEGF